MSETEKKQIEITNEERKKLLFTVSPHWQNYLSSIFLIIVFPLAPVFIVDYLIINNMTDINVQSLSITASIYFITIGFSSNNKLTLILGILGCFTFAVIYGRVETEIPKTNYTIEKIEGEKIDGKPMANIPEDMSKPIENKQLKLIGVLCIIFISLVHGIERYNRHVVLKEPFFEIS